MSDREEYILLMLNSTAEAVYGIDVNGLCTFANAACARVLGYAEPGQLLGRHMHDLIHHSTRDGAQYPIEECRVYKAFQENVGSHAEDEVLWRADGSSFPVEYWSYPIRRDGQVVGSVVTFHDITERRQLEQQFRRAQQRLRDVVASSPAVLFTLEIGDGKIQGVSWTSDNLREILGYPPEAAVGKDFWLLNVHPDDLETVKTRANADLFGQGHTVQDFRFRRADGREQWIRSEIRMIRDETGQPLEAVGAWLDITERKRAAEEQSKLREQLQQAQKLESVGRLAAGVAHDFNNLLTVINGYSDVLLRRLKPDDILHESAWEIRQAGTRAAELVRQLLLLSRKQISRPAEVNLNDIVREVEKMLARTIGEDVRLETALSPSLGCVLADAGQCHQLLMNLAINARDAMPAGGTLLIETLNIEIEGSAAAKAGPHVQLKVSDSGLGIPKEAMPHLFEPFFTTKRQGEGTGLGLATVYGIVKQSGGLIWAESEPGAGATFTICLPRIDAGTITPPERDREPEPASLQGTETILIVEDQAQVRKMSVRVLRSHGYRVLEAANPGEALLVSENYAGPIHLLLSDIIMPGMTGPDLAAHFAPLRPAMKVVFMSGYSERAIADRLNLAGTYLAKPFSPTGLAIKVREVLGPFRPSGTILVADDEPGIRSFLREMLTRAGYDILEAKNGKEVMRQVETARVDLVIMDLAMPEQEGIETIQILHQIQPQLKIIATSGQFAALLRAAEYLGAHAALAKPIETIDLLDTVARIIASRGEENLEL
jgi:two-component system, cell cycle sensor histidine kinase and response regulator CckA